MSNLHEKYGKNAPAILMKTIQSQVTLANLPQGIEVENKGNHYILKNKKASLQVPLCSVKDVFKVLNTFCKN